MKIIKYNLCVKTDGGEVLCGVEMPWNEANEAIAKAEAHNGEYTVEDDGRPEPDPAENEAAQLGGLAAAVERGLTT